MNERNQVQLPPRAAIALALMREMRAAEINLTREQWWEVMTAKFPELPRPAFERVWALG